MRCSEARKLISEYIDGNLDAKSSPVKKHLEDCSDCQRVLKDFQSITEKAKKLEKLSPSPQTWFKIMSKLTAEEQRVMAIRPQKKEWFSFLSYPGRFKYALSAALVLLVIIGIVAIGPRFWRGKDVFGGNGTQKFTLAKLQEAEHHYQLAIKALMEAVSAQEGNINPQTAEVFRKNLDIIDSTITACQQAVIHEPDNIVARNYLLAAYMEKVDLLNTMMDIKKKSPLKRELEKTL
jgi:anti-sigma factor RsiW